MTEPDLTRACHFCREPVDPLDHTVYRRAVGWERKAFGETRRGGSDIVLRELRDEYACPVCVARLRAGLDARQESLL